VDDIVNKNSNYLKSYRTSGQKSKCEKEKNVCNDIVALCVDRNELLEKGMEH